jgi:hypothetical protein
VAVSLPYTHLACISCFSNFESQGAPVAGPNTFKARFSRD